MCFWAGLPDSHQTSCASPYIPASLAASLSILLFSATVNLEVGIPNGVAQDGEGPSSPHRAEAAGGNKISAESLVSWGCLAANCVCFLIIFA